MTHKSLLTLISSAALLAALPAWAFGIPGSNGYDGNNGYNGENGQDITVVVDGQPHNFNLAGQPGGDATRGQNGQAAYGCSQPLGVEENLLGAGGGSGGSGGHGGWGGRGGDTTIHYNQRSDLRLITIWAPGARGGRGAPGGLGAPGCTCYNHSWSVRECKDVLNPEPNPNHQTHKECHDEYFSCQDGAAGVSGNYGQDGGNGREGRIVLIQNPKVVTQDEPDQEAPLSELVQSPATLTENLWNRESGALTLLGPGSVVSDDFVEFDRQIAVPVGVSWKEPHHPLTAFAVQRAELHLQQGEFSYDLPGMWQSSHVENAGASGKTIVVDHAYLDSEVGNVEFTYLDNSGKDLTARITDLNSLSPLVPATFQVTYETKTAIVFWKTRFAGPVPQELVRTDGNRYLVNIGRLPIDPAFLRGSIKVTVTVHLELGDKSVDKTFTRTAKF